MIDTKKEALEFLVKNPGGSINNLKKIDGNFLEYFKILGYLEIAGDNYEFTKKGLKTYKNVYAPVSLGEALTSLLLSALRLK